ncbi:hypothetical protein BME96_17095 [Virgibacillus halodenitrificans]|uniref:Uncharacterized protein n=1 Tax=Virgibacillus halodenitrificans TaxID=1482 RepID=A0AAC9J397_VIRHA|nr:hypothetical protein BME96_17095 [Virgibacillus halodenitrificans]
MFSASGGRFPPAWLQPLPPLRSVQGLQLMLFRQESPPSAPINLYELKNSKCPVSFFLVLEDVIKLFQSNTKAIIAILY